MNDKKEYQQLQQNGFPLVQSIQIIRSPSIHDPAGELKAVIAIEFLNGEKRTYGIYPKEKFGQKLKLDWDVKWDDVSVSII